MYAIGLVEASLTTLPKELQKTKKAEALSRRYGIEPQYLLLDVSVFFEEMRKHGIPSRLGRPDITHQFLLATQYAPLNLDGMLRVFIHTADDALIYVKPETRVPKNYIQFVSLVQRLLRDGRVPPKGEWLMKVEKTKGLDDALARIGVSKPAILHEHGEPLSCELAKGFTYPPYAFLVGGFPKGDFGERTLSLAWKRFSIKGGRPLDAWLVADRVIACLEGNPL